MLVYGLNVMIQTYMMQKYIQHASQSYVILKCKKKLKISHLTTRGNLILYTFSILFQIEEIECVSSNLNIEIDVMGLVFINQNLSCSEEFPVVSSSAEDYLSGRCVFPQSNDNFY